VGLLTLLAGAAVMGVMVLQVVRNPGEDEEGRDTGSDLAGQSGRFSLPGDGRSGRVHSSIGINWPVAHEWIGVEF
jgi:hypothetical protein